MASGHTTTDQAKLPWTVEKATITENRAEQHRWMDVDVAAGADVHGVNGDAMQSQHEGAMTGGRDKNSSSIISSCNS